MKSLKHLAVIVAMALGLTGSALADDNGGTGSGSGSGSGSGPGTGGGPGEHRPGDDKGGIRGPRPSLEIPKIGVPPDANIPDALKALIKQYQDSAQKFAAAQKDLLATLKGATDEQKAKIKEQLKANRDQFLTDTATLRADIREQLRELRNTLKGSTAGAVEGGAEGKGKGGGRRP